MQSIVNVCNSRIINIIFVTCSIWKKKSLLRVCFAQNNPNKQETFLRNSIKYVGACTNNRLHHMQSLTCRCYMKLPVILLVPKTIMNNVCPEINHIADLTQTKRLSLSFEKRI